jgi:outer membrane lipopolysaccharide assembly protein LptE/RlpB
MINRKRASVVFTFLPFLMFLFNLVGCGYTLQGSGSVLPPDVKKIYIPFVENDSTEGAIANLFTESLRDQFERYGVVTVTNTRAESDAELLARIKKVTRNTRSTTARTDVADQFDTTLTLDVRLLKKNGTPLWVNQDLQVSTQVAASTTGLVSSSANFAGGLTTSSELARLDPRQFARSQEQVALQTLAQNAATLIYNSAVAPDF